MFKLFTAHLPLAPCWMTLLAIASLAPILHAQDASLAISSQLSYPAEGKIPVAFVVGQDAEVLDFCGPLEIIAAAYTPAGAPLFAPYTVAETTAPVTIGGPLKVVPDYSFKTAPQPRIVVIPAMGDPAATPAMIDWIARHRKRRRSSSTSTYRLWIVFWRKMPQN